MHGSPGSDPEIMFGEAVATRAQDSSLSSLTDASMSNPNLGTLMPGNKDGC